MEWLPIVLAIIASIPGLLALNKDYRLGRPDALKRYQELADELTGKISRLQDTLSIQATKIEAQTSKIEAQAAKIEAQAAKIEAQAIVIADLTSTVRSQGRELEDFRIGVVILISQLREINVEPKWTPKEKKAEM